MKPTKPRGSQGKTGIIHVCKCGHKMDVPMPWAAAPSLLEAAKTVRKKLELTQLDFCKQLLDDAIAQAQRRG